MVWVGGPFVGLGRIGAGGWAGGMGWGGLEWRHLLRLEKDDVSTPTVYHDSCDGIYTSYTECTCPPRPPLRGLPNALYWRPCVFIAMLLIKA